MSSVNLPLILPALHSKSELDMAELHANDTERHYLGVEYKVSC